MKYIIGVIICLALGGGYYFYSQKKSAITYEPVKVEKGTIEVKILTTGTVQPKNRLEIKPPISGRVEEILVVEGQKVRKGEILAWMSSTERAAMLDAARAQGPAEVRRWEQMYRPTPVISPIHGMVILRNVESGQTFMNTEAILVLSDQLTVKAQVDETDMAQVKLKQNAIIILDAYPNEKILGHVDQIAFEAKTTNNVTTYQIEVLPVSTPEFMRSGMTANVSFQLAVKENVLSLPVELVKKNQEGSFVLFSNSDETPTEKKIEVGLSDGKKIEIISGLNEGETVFSAQDNSDKTKSSNPFSAAPKMNNTRRKK